MFASSGEIVCMYMCSSGVLMGMANAWLNPIFIDSSVEIFEVNFL